jgi:hypothetical protein
MCGVSLQLKYRFRPQVHLTKEQERICPLPLASPYDSKALRVRNELHGQELEEWVSEYRTWRTWQLRIFLFVFDTVSGISI